MEQPTESNLTAAPILYYDGGCPLCERSVRLVLRYDRRMPGEHQSEGGSGSGEATLPRMLFAPLGGVAGRSLQRANPDLDLSESLVLAQPTGGGVVELLRRSDAVLALGRYLGGGWKLLALLGGAVPRPLRDALYDLVARHRHALPLQECELPATSERGRFIP